MKRLDEMISKLPPEYQQEVENLLNLYFKSMFKKGRKLRKDWAGALEKYRDKYTSLKLQINIGMAWGLI